MTRPLKKMPTPLGVAAGAIASVALPIGLTYHRLYIVMEADLGAGPVPLPADEWENHVEEIRVMVNGDAQIIIDAKDLVALNAYHGMPDQEGTLALYLSQPWMRTANGEDQTAYGTVGLASFTLEIDLKEGISSPKLEVYAVQSPGTAYGMHLRVQKYTVPQGLEGERQIADIMRGNYGMLALHVNSDKVGDIEVHADQRKVLESTKVVRAAHPDPFRSCCPGGLHAYRPGVGKPPYRGDADGAGRFPSDGGFRGSGQFRDLCGVCTGRVIAAGKWPGGPWVDLAAPLLKGGKNGKKKHWCACHAPG